MPPKHPRETVHAEGLPPAATAYQEVAERELAAAKAASEELDARPMLYTGTGATEVVGLPLDSLEDLDEADTGEHKRVEPREA